MAAEPRSDSFRRVAAPWHTVFILALIAALAYWGKLGADQTRAVLNPDRVKIYERTILFEWLVLGVVLVGVWLNGSSLFAVLGGPLAFRPSVSPGRRNRAAIPDCIHHGHFDPRSSWQHGR